MACGPSESKSDLGPSTTLCDLPGELLMEIIQRLDNPALVNLGLTCHHLHFLALNTFFSNNDIHDPKGGWLVAYKTPVETLPALRSALFVRRLDQLHYYFNPPVDRMIEETRDLVALISRMPTIGLVKLHFSTVDQHFNFGGGEPRILDTVLWKEALQSLLELVLEKGCHELYVQGGETLIGLYPKQGDDVESQDVDDVRVIPPDLDVSRRRQRKNLFGKLRLGSFLGFVNRFFAPVQNVILRVETLSGDKVTHSATQPVRNLNPAKISIHSDILLRNPFLEWTVAMLNSVASTLRTLSIKLSDLPHERRKDLLHNITLPQLSNFELTCDFMVPLHGVCFTDLHSFLSRHPSIEILYLYGLEVSKEVWPPPSLRIPILPRLKSIIAHPFYVVWVLNSLLSDKKASRNLTDIGITSEYYRNATRFDYSLFDRALERIAAFPSAKIKLTLRFSSFGANDMNDWMEKHLDAAPNNASNPSIIPGLKNVTTVVISSCWMRDYDRKTIEILPDWLGMFPKLTAIDFTDQAQENVQQLTGKEFLRKVARACPSVPFMEVQKRRIGLDR